DYFQATKGGGHGDYHQIVLAPASVQEAVELTHLAFYLGDKYRMPVMLLGDGILGQMMEPVDADLNERLKKDNSLKIKDKPWILTGCKGREPRIIRSLLLEEGELEELNRRLQEKYSKINANEVKCETLFTDDANIILVAFGTTSRICRAVAMRMRKENIKVGVIRPITLWPFPSGIIDDVSSRLPSNGKRVIFLVVEMNAGQMVEDVRLGVMGRSPVKFYGRTGGGIPTEEEICNEVKRCLKQDEHKL
ncbi:MAG: 3-methyl-2-oxobutanoate dehydrogenase subunit beta, partial [Candidatus Omnitrophica bacterium]|nr:3-methyl-2-oxobutanoate dehydrogenase subunit beta [Candidatus Omnitrophota bacterium]